MRSTGLLFRRTLAQFGLLLALLGGVAVTTGVAVVTSSSIQHSEAAGVRAALAASAPTERAYRFSFGAADDSPAQSRATAERFTTALAGIPARFYREVVSPLLPVDREGVPFPTAEPQTSETQAAVVASPDFATGATLTAGVWPADAAADAQRTPGAVSITTATRLDIEVGDTLRVGDDAELVQIVGTWSALESPAWVGPSGVFSPENTAAAEPTIPALLVPEAAIMGLAGDATARWTVVADASAIDLGGLDRLIVASGQLQRELAGDGLAGGNVKVEGGLALAAERFRVARDAAHAVVPVGMSVVLLIGAATIIQLARLLVVSRMPETVLLRARGASSWLTVANAVEAVLVSIIGAAAGLAAARAADGWAGAGSSGIVPALAIAAGTVAIMMVSARGDRVTGAREFEVYRSGRAGSRAIFWAAALLVPLATIALGQFLEYGSPRVQDAAGRNSIDVVVAMAPALGIIAAAVALLALTHLSSRGLAIVAAKGRRLQPALSVRQFSRRFSQHAGAILIIGLAVSGLTVASAYSATEARLSADSAELRNGAAVRVLQPSDQRLRPQELPAATAASAVLTADVAIGSRSDDATLLALPAAGIRSVMASAHGTVDTDALSRVLEVDQPPAPTIPAKAETLSYQLIVAARAPRTDDIAPTGTGTVAATIWLEDSVGTLRPFRSEAFSVFSEVPRAVTVAVDLPSAEAPWRIVAVDVRADADPNWTFQVELAEFVTISGAAERAPLSVDPNGWAPQLLFSEFGTAAFSPTASGLEVVLGLHEAPAGGARLMPTGKSNLPGTFWPGTAEPLPVVVGASVADTLGVGAADWLQLTGSELTVESTIVSTVPTVPGSPSRHAVVADLSALNHYLLRTSEQVVQPNEVWLASTAPEATTQELRSAGASVVSAAELARSPMADSAGTALWLAAAGCLVLAVMSLAAMVAGAARSRRADVVALTLVGVRSGTQARQRMLELLVISGTGLLIGLGGGSAISALVIPSLARSVVADPPAGLLPGLSFSLVPGLALLSITVVGFLAVAAVHALMVSRQARRVGSTRVDSSAEVL